MINKNYNNNDKEFNDAAESNGIHAWIKGNGPTSVLDPGTVARLHFYYYYFLWLLLLFVLVIILLFILFLITIFIIIINMIIIIFIIIIIIVIICIFIMIIIMHCWQAALALLVQEAISWSHCAVFNGSHAAGQCSLGWWACCQATASGGEFGWLELITAWF